MQSDFYTRGGYGREGQENHVRRNLHPFVPLGERRQFGKYPTHYPWPSDHYHVDHATPTHQKQPHMNMRDYLDQLRNSFKKQTVERRFANTQGRPTNSAPFNIAAANGHPHGRAGLFGNAYQLDQDPRLGGLRIMVPSEHHDIRSFGVEWNNSVLSK